MLNSIYLSSLKPCLFSMRTQLEKLEAHQLNLECRSADNPNADTTEAENSETLNAMSESIFALFIEISELAKWQQVATRETAWGLVQNQTKPSGEDWQAVEARLYAISEALECEGEKLLGNADTLYHLASQMRALNQAEDNEETRAQKAAFAKAEPLTLQQTKLALKSEQLKALCVNFPPPKAPKQAKEAPLMKDWYSPPEVPLNTPCGYQERMRWVEATGVNIDLEGALTGFSLALEMATNIPFIYDSVRENAQRPQELNAVLETLTQLHRTHANHLMQDFEALSTDLLEAVNTQKPF